MSDSSKTYVAVNGKARDIGFLAAILKRAQDIFWYMVVAAVGILAIAWDRYFIRRFF